MAGVHENPKLSERALQFLPFRRRGRPAGLGAVAVHLAGDGSTWHRGDELVLDGGYRVV